MSQIERIVLKGKLPRKNVPWPVAITRLQISKGTYQVPIGMGASPYLGLAVQGATIVPRAVWFVRIPKGDGGEVVDAGEPYVVTDDAIKGKKPWDDVHFQGEIEARFLFGSALGQDVVPFAIGQIRPVVLPIAVDKDDKVKLLDQAGAIHAGAPNLASWLASAEKTWNKLRKKGSTLSIYSLV